MSGAWDRAYADSRFSTLLDPNGEPPCSPPDDCPVCGLFDRQQPPETRREWLARIVRGAARPVYS